MWTIRVKYISALLILSALLWFLPSVGGCSPTYQITEEELTALQNHLTVLETNNETLKNILSESNEDLTKALEALMKSQSELMTLKTQLQKAKNDAESAKASLKIANDELQKASQYFKECEAAHTKTENRLRNQRNVWEFIAALAVGVAVAK
jgi:chromosome segregation ATPase